jgi:hypothetical protein
MNNLNTIAYQVRKLKTGYNGIICLSGLNLFNTQDFRLNLPSSTTFLAFALNSGNKPTEPALVF